MSVSVAKVRFKVVGCTSWEDGYHPKSMEEMHPFVTGWKSERYCPYPQQFVVCLRSKARIRKIQLLSHEYMIASKIELFVGRGSVQGQVNSLLNIQYTRLGYVSLSANDATNYKSREMKSINIDAEGQYLKLVLHTNHVNQLNLYNQVSVLALNILGHDPLSHITKSQSIKVTGRQPPVHVSTINDLSFDMTLDPSSARLVKQLEAQKQQAIEKDQFELAKALKEAINEMIKVGQVLCHYEREKRHAIEREDFDEAKKWKSEKDSIEIQLKERLNFEQLLRGEIPIAREQRRKDKKVHYVPEELTNDTSTRQSNLPSLSSGQHLPSEPPVNQPMNIELPHINTSQQQNNYSEYPDEDAEMPPSQPEPLTDAQLNEAAVAVQVFGDITVAKVFSKLYHLREQGLTDVLDIMKKETSFSRSEMTKALCQILRRGFSDKVLTSFNIAIDILKELMGEYAKHHRLSSSDLVTVLDKILPVVMNRFADTNTRIQSSSMRAILDLAAIPEVKPLLGHYLLRPLAQDKTKSLDDGSKLTISMETQARTVTWRYAKGRVEVLQAFLEVVDLGTAHMTIPKIMEFVNISLQHNHAKVREAAAQLTVYLYKEYQDGAIRELLPVSSSDHIAMKNIFWRTLFQQLDEIDGVAHISGQESFEKAKKMKQKRLNNLKGELDALRSLAQATGQQLPTSEDSENIATVAQTRVIDSATIEQTCPFCKSSRPEFNVKAHMDEHYAAECPMLLQCKKCTQVVEIKNYGAHMLNDCSSQTEMAECPKCHEVFGKTQLESHMKGSRCTAPPDDHVKCPLCHTNVQNNDESWHNHLMSVSSGCTKNPRRKRRRPGQQHVPASKAPEGVTVIPR